MLNILEKHKLIGGSGGRNTLTYLETTDADFEIGELYNVVSENGVLQKIKIDKTIDDKCELWIDGTNPCVDKSPNPKALTSSTSAYSDETEGDTLKFGSGQYIKLTEAINIGENEDFTIEFKIKRISSDTSSNRWIISDSSTNGSGNGSDIRLTLINTTGHLTLVLKTLSLKVENIGKYIPVGKWCTLTIERYMSIVYIRINGEIRGQSTSEFTSSFSIKANTYFMNWKENYGAHFSNCYLKDLLITRKSIYRGNILTPHLPYSYRISPTLSRPPYFKSAKVNWEGEGSISISEDKSVINDSTIFYLDGNEFKDKSPKNATITNSGATINDEGKFDKCMDFAGGKLTFTLDGSFVNKDFTIDWWEYDYHNIAQTNGLSSVFNNTTTSSGNSFGLGITNNTSVADKSPLRHGLNIASSTSTYYLQDWLYGNDIYDRWVHRALVRKDNVIYAYEDGKLYNTAENIPTTIPVVNTFQMGRWRTNDINTCKKISEFRVSNKAMWHSEFTPSSHSYIYYENTKISKGELIKELPTNFSLKEEVKDDETISNVSLEMRSKLGNFYMSPKDDKDTSKFYLYNEGDECTDITGGWKNGEFMNLSNTSWLVSAYAIKNTNNLEYGDNNANGTWYGYGGFITNSKVDLTPYSKMFIDWEMYQASVTTYNGGSGSVVNAIAYSDSTSVKVGSGLTQLASIVSKQGAYNTNRVVTEIDISNISGQKHICVNGQAGYINTDLVKNRTYKIWLEK